MANSPQPQKVVVLVAEQSHCALRATTSTVLGNSVDSSITHGSGAARPINDDPPPVAAGLRQAAYLSPGSDTQLDTVTSLLNAGELARASVAGMLSRWCEGQAVTPIAHAAAELGRWLSLHGNTTGSIEITASYKAPRVLIEFIDQGNRTPDPYRSRIDAALAYAVLSPYVVGWGWEISTDGTRTARIYGDTRSPAAPGNGGYFERLS